MSSLFGGAIIMKNKIIIAIIIILILGAVVYWYEVRPAMIRSSCGWKANEYFANNVDNMESVYQVDNLVIMAELKFELCKNIKGIK